MCVLRYRRHYYMASGIDSRAVAAEFLEHAGEEAKHAHWLAERIVELDGEPELDPKSIAEHAATQYVTGADLADMIEENLVAERIVIDWYTETIRFLGSDDPTSRRIFEKILEDEEEHAEELQSLLGSTRGEPAAASQKVPVAKAG